MLCPSIYGVSWSESNHLPHLSCDGEALKEAGIPTIISFCEDICDTGYDTIFNATLGNKHSKLDKY